jgi:hypothetical protein
VVPYASTHVSVDLPGTNLRPVAGGFVPDTCREGTLHLTDQPPQRTGLVRFRGR